MKLERVYLVIGECGEYSDRREWLVCAYKSEDDAKWHAELAQARSQQVAEWECPKCDFGVSICDCSGGASKPLNAYDPVRGHEVGYYGARYYVSRAVPVIPSQATAIPILSEEPKP